MMQMMKLVAFNKFKLDIEDGIDEINLNEEQIDSKSSENIFNDIISDSVLLSFKNDNKTKEEDYKDKEE